jgi:hypothetical protein
MPFVARDAGGRIVAVYARRSQKAQEEVDANAPEVKDFLERDEAGVLAREHLIESDLAMVRVLEDLIFVLIDKGVLMFHDLPEAARRKLVQRRDLRNRLTDLGGLIDASEDMPI